MVIPQDCVCCLKSENHLNTVADPGEESGPPLFLDQTEARRAEKNFFETRPPHPLSQGLDGSSPPYLKVWIRHCNKLNLSLRVWKGLFSSGLKIKWGCDWVWLIPELYMVTWQSGLVYVSTQIGGSISKCFLNDILSMYWFWSQILSIFLLIQTGKKCLIEMQRLFLTALRKQVCCGINFS